MFNAITKSLTTLVVVAGALLNTNLSPDFTNVQVEYSNHDFICSAQLNNCFDEHLEKVFQSGQKVRITYTIFLFISNSDTKIAEKEINREIEFDLIDEVYKVKRSEEHEWKLFETLDEAKDQLTIVEKVTVTNSLQLDLDQRFYLKINATINPIFLDIFQKNYDLMKYWNNKSPSYRTKDLRLKNKRT
ncbi:MAG: DUF4390 domain-containing protein [Candidatus Cloacimonadota bacterium]|nr:DUF4390 domain-containing protein [Candidatus Cloacimonadota bacterium]